MISASNFALPWAQDRPCPVKPETVKIFGLESGPIKGRPVLELAIIPAQLYSHSIVSFKS